MADSALRSWLVRLSPILGLVAVIGVFALLSDAPAQYLSGRNLSIVLAQTVIVALGAIGMTMIIVSGGIDLSVGSTIALTGVVTAVMLRDGYTPSLALAAGVLVGGLVGWSTGWRSPGSKVLPFIATLGTLGVARGAAKWLADQQTVNPPVTWVNELAVTFPTPSWLLVAPGVWIALVLALVMTVVLRQHGVRPPRLRDRVERGRGAGVRRRDRSLKVWIYGLAGLFFGLSGVTQMSRLRQGDPTVAIGTELDIIAAVVIGGGSLAGGEGTIARRDDRRADDGVSAQRHTADGLAELHPGDHHRHHHRPRRRRGSRPADPGTGTSVITNEAPVPDFVHAPAVRGDFSTWPIAADRRSHCEVSSDSRRWPVLVSA